MRIEFTIHGKPQAKGRPRFARMGNFVKTYTPKDSATYENLVRTEFVQVFNGAPLSGPIRLDMKAYFPMPKSMRKADREQARFEQLPLTKKPDIDNLVKSVLDGLNTVAFEDDKQVYAITCSKWYSLQPRTEVTVIQPALPGDEMGTPVPKPQTKLVL